MNPKKIAQVVIPRPLLGPLSYVWDSEKIPDLKIGCVIRVPFRSSDILGFVVETLEIDQLAAKTDHKLKLEKLKEVECLIHPEPVFSALDLSLYQWISDYYQIPIGEVFHSAFPKTVFSRIPSNEVISKFCKGDDVIQPSLLELTGDQQVALSEINGAIDSKQFKSFLLYGVTGSGKTEIYLRAAKDCLSRGKTVLILVPEIALTPQLRNRFEERFGSEVAVLHSGLSEKLRRQHWWGIVSGQKRLVVGARSALFAPVKDIGLIVVDEEHEPSYKQEDRLRYNARDLALVRARQHGAVALLGSATPSIETFHAASEGKHTLLSLKERPLSRPMPNVRIIDLCDDPYPDGDARGVPGNSAHPRGASGKASHFSHAFVTSLRETISRGEQALVFVNRKGYSNFLLCRDCGDVPKCLNCSVSLTFYQSTREMKCNYCGYFTGVPKSCVKCQSPELKFAGMGTESVEEELNEIFKGTKIARFDAEVANSAKKIEEILEKFRAGEIQILVGTQMLAKGHDFPNVTFVGVVLADLSLNLPDFRSGERTFQLLTQVAGRAGRAEKPGTVILQTYVPDHYVIQAAAKQDYAQFFKEEIQIRKEFGYPPFSRMAQLEFRNLKESAARDEAEQTRVLIEHLIGAKANSMDDSKGLEYLGPAAATLAKVANQFRWHILLKAEKSSSLNALIRTLRKEGVRFIDVDPVSTL